MGELGRRLRLDRVGTLVRRIPIDRVRTVTERIPFDRVRALADRLPLDRARALTERLPLDRVRALALRIPIARLEPLAQRLATHRLAVMCAMLGVVAMILAGSVSPAPAQRPADSAVGPDGSATGRRAAFAVPGRPESQQSGTSGTGKTARQPASTAPASESPVPPSPTPIQTTPAAPTSVPPSPQLPIVTTVPTGQVALTFDDGPDAATPQVLALLRQYGVKATFCIIGVNVRGHHDLVRQIVADGHTLCNHTWRHDLQLGTRSVDTIRNDLQRTSDEIHAAVPDAPIKYFRHPGGNFTPAAVAVAQQLGMVSIGWDVDPRDWDIKRYGAGAPMAEHIVSVVTRSTRPGSIVLSHDGGGNRAGTVQAYQRLLPWLLERFQLTALPV